MANEDLTLTPAERAAAAASGQAGRVDPCKEEAALYASAKEIIVGDGAEPQIVVIGAGLVGSLAAVALQRKGFQVTVFERYPDMRSIPSAGKSINLSVTSRGLRCIRALGGDVYDEIMSTLCTKVEGRIIHMPDGTVVFQRYGKDGSEFNNSVSRVELNKYLIDLAASSGVEFRFNHQLSETSDFVSIGAVGCNLHFRTGADGNGSRLRVKVQCPVIACDGAGSRVRYALRRAGLTSFEENLIPRGYKEILFPNPGENHFGAKDENAGETCHGRYGLHIWPRGEHMLMALSNVDGSFTGTLYVNNKGEDESFDAFSDTPEGRKKCAAFCEKYYQNALPLIGGLDEMVRQIVTNPTGILGTVDTTEWAHKGKVVMIGDACHAMVPFFGQGCNCGFEDTLWLSRLLDKFCCRNGKIDHELCTDDNFASVFSALAQERKPNADAICAMALENFIEMRDKTGDARFQALKKVENKLENVYPHLMRSRYAMVCYGGEGNVSYANAKLLGTIQWEILEELCAHMQKTEELSNAENLIDLERARKLLEEKIVPKHKELGIDLSTIKH